MRDTSSAGVPRAKIILRNEDTGITLEVATNEAGIYVSPPLRSGVYVVEVEAPGFERAARRVQLDVSQRAAIDFELKVGAVTQAKEVQAVSAVLQTETSTLSNLRSERAIKDLPLNSRNFAQLIGLAAGAMPAQTQQAGSPITMKRGVTGYAINGTRPEENNFLLDGINNNENHNGLGVLIFPPIDAVQEFRVESSVANAQFGRGGGGTINLTYKGTKQVDLLLFKEFYLSEGGARRIQFRSEFFSITNTPQFNNPAATVGAAGAGSIRAAGSPLTFQRTSRQIQFALKVYFCSRDVTGAETSRTIVKSPPEV